MKTIAESWAEYEKRLISIKAGPAQRRDMRLAFYSGAITVMSKLLKAGKPEVSEEMAQKIFNDVAAELDNFMDGVIEGVKAGEKQHVH